MRFSTSAIAVTLLMLHIVAAPLAAQSLTADLTDLLRRDASPPFLTSVPVPSGAAFLAVNADAFDLTNPRAVTEAKIDRFPLGAGQSVSLRLRRMDVMNPRGIAVAGTTSGDVPFELEKHLIFSGSVDGVTGSFVYLAMFRRYCVGYVDMPGPDGVPDRYIIAPDNADGIGQASVVIYNTRLLPLPERAHTECSAENLPDYQQRVESVFRKLGMGGEYKVDGGSSKLLAPATLAAQIAVECDMRYFKAHSSSLSQSANYVLIVLGASSAIYQRDANVALQIPYLRVWTTVGPYAGPNINDLLGQLRTHWNTNMGPVGRSTTLMLSHNIGGGLAWVNVLCSGDYGYAVSGLNNDVNFPADSYLWDVDVTSHELGHNFGSSHTHNCVWAPPIDSCVEPEGGCGKETNPHTGSIMSYCHLNAGTQLHFHPRVATLIRRNFENAGCVGPVESTLANDMAVVSITSPALGGKISRDAMFTPAVTVRNIGTTTQTNLSITFTIDSSTATGAQRYTNTQTVAALAAGASVPVTFLPTSIAVNGTYEAKATIGPADDARPINNTMVRPFEVVNPSSPGTITVKSPNGGESYAAGNTTTIQWEATGVTTITIQFSTDNGISWSPVRYNRTATQGTLAWIVPAIPTTQGRIRINDLNDASISDMSDAPFTITVQKDVQAIDFINPAIDGLTATPTVPRVEFRNNGRQTVTNVPVRLRMMWRGDGSEVYNQTVTIPQIAPGAVEAVNFPATRLLPLGTHVMIARAMLDGDEYPWNDSIGRTGNFDGIAPPIGVTAYPMSRAVLLRWHPSPAGTETGYQIFRGTSLDAMTPIASLRSSVLAYADEPLADGTQYFYGISSTTSDTKTSIYSRIVSATPMTYPAGFTLAAPEPILPAENASGVAAPVEFLWGTLEGGVTYQLQVAANEAMTDVLNNTLTSDPRANMQVAFSTGYYWRVRAFNYSSIGQWSNVRHFTTGNGCGGGALALDGVAARMKSRLFTWRDTAVTVEFWNYVRTSDLKNSSAFSVGTEANNKRFQAHVPWGDKTLFWDYGNLDSNGRISTNYGPYLDKWTHVALVSNGKNFKGIYLDGVLVASGTRASFPSERSELVIGCFVNDSYHKGMIDEFRIWNRVRTQQEIEGDMRRRLSTPQPGLMGYWRFDEGSGLQVPDLSGNGGHGELTSDSLWALSEAPINCDNPVPLAAPDMVSPANDASFSVLFAPTFLWDAVPGATAYHLQLAVTKDFDTTERNIPNIAASSRMVPGLRPGTRYYWRVRAVNEFGTSAWSGPMSFTTATTCAANALSFTGASGLMIADSFMLNGRGITVEFWNYVEASNVRTGSAFSIGRADSLGNRLQSHAPWTDRNLYWDYGNVRTTGRITTSYASYLGRWTHVALVSDGQDLKSIYLNGEPVASAAISDMAHDLSRLTVGGIQGMWYHNGMIDEFRIWNTPRTREQIKQDMYRKLAPPQSGLVGYWSLDEGSGVQAHDSSGFRHDGLLQPNDSLWKNGQLIPIAPIAEPLSGPIICAPGSVENFYGVTPEAGTQYTWSITGGTVVAGAGTPAIAVQWADLDGQGVVSLRRDHDGCADSVYLQVQIGTGAGVESGEAITGLSFSNAPEPFTSSTVISYHLLHREQVTLSMYSLDGALVRRLVDASQDAGDHQVIFNGEGLAAGIYICRFGVGDRYLYVKALHLVR